MISVLRVPRTLPNAELSKETVNPLAPNNNKLCCSDNSLRNNINNAKVNCSTQIEDNRWPNNFGK